MNHIALRYPLGSFDFPSVVSQCLGEPNLRRLGTDDNIPLRTRETDQDTRWHRAFYDTFMSWQPLYNSFVATVVTRIFREKFYYQAVPTLRVHLSNNLAVGNFHTDRDYGHPDGELTFWIPLTPAFDTNTIWIESAPGFGDYRPVHAEPGTMVVFDAGHLRHGNLRNKTGVTRVSFDFRCLRERDYKNTRRRSVNAGLAFAPGGYYAPHPLDSIQ